jgi:hypothetical protein
MVLLGGAHAGGRYGTGAEEGTIVMSSPVTRCVLAVLAFFGSYFVVWTLMLLMP